MKIFELKIYNLRIQILAAKMTKFHLGIFSLPVPSPYRIHFSVQFSAQYIHITRIFKAVSHSFQLLCCF